MKSERITFLATPQFKTNLSRLAAQENSSVGAVIHARFEQAENTAFSADERTDPCHQNHQRSIQAVTDDVKRAGDMLKEVSRELRDHDRRITRLEAQWDTTLHIATLRKLDGSGDP